MEMNQLAPDVLAFTHPGRSSCSVIRTPAGTVLVDTTARPNDIHACLAQGGITPEDVCQTFVTHSHSDHTNGVPLFECPVVAHKKAKQRIAQRKTGTSQQQIPTDIFESEFTLDIGGVQMELRHAGGHTPGSSVGWLASRGILFAGDLIFSGRYPFLPTADILRLMEMLRWLPSFNAQMIVPGHGPVCDYAEVTRQLGYIEATWERTIDHLRQGHSVEETLEDSGFPVYSDLGREKLHD